MRGKGIVPCIQRRFVGITPAYAGKSLVFLCLALTSQDHPRVCGEKPFTTTLKPAFIGITPAYAGKRSQRSCPAQDARDHPRVCGEKSFCLLPLHPHTGSPPRMRGKGLLRPDSFNGAGITPAYAGKSASVTFVKLSVWDHPRVCGEKFLVYRYPMNHLGSPPRMRGKVFYRDDTSAEVRITPAYAGKRLKGFCEFCQPQDHPRVCGEKTKKIP